MGVVGALCVCKAGLLGGVVKLSWDSVDELRRCSLGGLVMNAAISFSPS